MVTIFTRTLIIYLFLILSIRLMGKRQIGELEVSELITTLLLSEIASLPITDTSIPISHSIVPIITLVTFEVVSSYLLVRFPRLKNIISTRPSVLIDKGVLKRKNMIEARISADELMTELRQKGVCSISEVQYAILEQNGKITVIQKAAQRTPTVAQLKIKATESGISHIVICEGKLNKKGMRSVSLDKKMIINRLKNAKVELGDVYIMTVDDAGNEEIIRKEN